MSKENILYAVIALLVGILGTVLVVGVSTKNQSAVPAGVVTPGAGSPTDYQQRIAEAEKIVAQDPKNVQAWIMLGNDYFDTEQPQKSINAYAKALELKPNDTNVLTDQGVMFRKVGFYDRALANFEKAQQIDPSHLQSLYNIGIVYRDDLNKPEKTVEAWTKYLKLDATSPAAQQIKAQLDQLKASLPGKK
jgi:cytochrome c-type biogenesis protein CcmH/NrfG